MTTSNLTAAERDVLEFLGDELRTIEPTWGLSKWVALNLRMSRSWVCYVLKRLVDSGHVRKVSRGVYEVTE